MRKCLPIGTEPPSPRPPATETEPLALKDGPHIASTKGSGITRRRHVGRAPEQRAGLAGEPLEEHHVRQREVGRRRLADGGEHLRRLQHGVGGEEQVRDVRPHDLALDRPKPVPVTAEGTVLGRVAFDDDSRSHALLRSSRPARPRSPADASTPRAGDDPRNSSKVRWVERLSRGKFSRPAGVAPCAHCHRVMARAPPGVGRAHMVRGCGTRNLSASSEENFPFARTLRNHRLSA